VNGRTGEGEMPVALVVYAVIRVGLLRHKGGGEQQKNGGQE